MQQELPGLETAPTEAKDKSTPDILAGLEELGGSENCLILTPNQPLAQQLRRLRLVQAEKQVVQGGQVYVLSSWLADSIQHNAKKPLASQQQLTLLWQLALENSQQQFPDLNPVTLAPHAHAAWVNLKRYQVPPEDLRNAEVGQLARFSKTIEKFESLLQKSGLTALELEIELELEAKDSPDSESAQHACLYAFIEPLPPLIESWLNHRFKHLHTANYLTSNAESFLYPARDADAELRAAGSWAHEVLLHHPKAKIGIVHTDLADELNKSVRLIKAALPEETKLSTSIQAPLSDQGLIRSALGLIQLNLYEIENAQARFIIHTPFWSDFKAEYELRAQWDTEFCNLQSRQIKPEQLRELLDDKTTEVAATLRQRLLDFIDARRRAPKTQSPLNWANLFHRQLEVLGWPGTVNEGTNDKGTVHKEQNQALIQNWLDALRDFSELGSVSGDIDLRQALALLQRCCDTRRTDPSAAHTGVRLLDTVESAADYSHLWLVGIDQTRWPSAPSPNPLLPLGIQRKYPMPRTQADQETELAKSLLERVSKAATEIVFSYAQTADDIEQKPCGLLPDLDILPKTKLGALPSDGRAQRSQPSSAHFEYIDTEFAPPLLEHETLVAGGSSLLRSMAASPFDAFAQWRLGAYALPEPKIGLNAAERGTLVHWVLDSLWNKLGTFEKLQALSDEERVSICVGAARKEVQRWQGRYGWLGPAYAELEIQRLASLARRWLELELTRSPFEILKAEEKLTANLGGLSFNLRLDRLDRLGDGSLLLVDYKTGQSLGAKQWLEMPPAEPQLPLYAISLEQAPDAICFAQVRPDQIRLIGIGREILEKGFSDIENWDDLLEMWRNSLTELAENYAKGLARVDETSAGFGRQDPLAPLHRMSEYEALCESREKNA